MFFVLVLWLLSEARLPTESGMLQSLENFTTLQACVEALPRYEAAVVRDFGAPGIVVCAART